MGSDKDLSVLGDKHDPTENHKSNDSCAEHHRRVDTGSYSKLEQTMLILKQRPACPGSHVFHQVERISSVRGDFRLNQPVFDQLATSATDCAYIPAWRLIFDQLVLDQPLTGGCRHGLWRKYPKTT